MIATNALEEAQSDQDLDHIQGLFSMSTQYNMMLQKSIDTVC